MLLVGCVVGGPASRFAILPAIASGSSLRDAIGNGCSSDDHLCPLDVQDWSDFAALGFALETPRRYDYAVTSTASDGTNE